MRNNDFYFKQIGGKNQHDTLKNKTIDGWKSSQDLCCLVHTQWSSW